MANEVENSYSPSACKVLELAHSEAKRLRCDYVGAEHILLGIIALKESRAMGLFEDLGLSIPAIRQEVEGQVGKLVTGVLGKNPKESPRFRKVLVLAGKEAKAMKHVDVGTEHLLLGLIREGDGIPARVLKKHKVDIDRVREEVLKLHRHLSGPATGPQPDDAKIMNGPYETAIAALSLVGEGASESTQNAILNLQLRALADVPALLDPRTTEPRIRLLEMITVMVPETGSVDLLTELAKVLVRIVPAGDAMHGVLNSFNQTTRDSHAERRWGIVLQVLQGEPVTVKYDFLREVRYVPEWP